MTHDHWRNHGRWARAYGGHHRMGMGRWGHGGGGGGRRERLFDQGDLRLVMLSMIAERPRHGYDIIKALEEMTGGAYSPSPGVVYPTLTLLQEQGLAEAVDSEGGKKMFTATDAGRAALETDKAAAEAIFARINEATSRSSGVTPRVVRAMENLRTALRLKLGQGSLTEEQVTLIVKTIDDAAGVVERA